MRVVEKAGESLKRILQRSNPLKERQSLRTDCLVCTKSGKTRQDQKWQERMEHKKLLNKKDEQSVLWRHCKEKHGSELQIFRMNVTGVFPKNAMLRQISEGIRIDKTPVHALFNNKTEWKSLHVRNPTF